MLLSAPRTAHTVPQGTPPSDSFPAIPETVYGVKKRLNFIYDVLRGLAPDARILDIGCGNGELLSIPLAEKGLSIIGVDTDELSLVHARAVAASRGVATATFKPLSSLSDLGTVDAVIASEVIEHVMDPEAFLRRIYDVLRPGGYLILTLPNGRGPFELDQWLWRHNFLFLPGVFHRLEKFATGLKERRGHGRSAATCNEHDPHINFFTLGRIRPLLRDAGFEQMRFEPRTIVCGNFPSILVQSLAVCGISCRRLVSLNASLASHAPPQVCSGWMFVCERQSRP